MRFAGRLTLGCFVILALLGSSPLRVVSSKGRTTIVWISAGWSRRRGLQFRRTVFRFGGCKVNRSDNQTQKKLLLGRPSNSPDHR